jgi:hypothetical protein
MSWHYIIGKGLINVRDSIIQVVKKKARKAKKAPKSLL